MSGRNAVLVWLGVAVVVLVAVLMLLREACYREHYVLQLDAAGFELQVPLPCNRVLAHEVRLKIDPPIATSIERSGEAITGRIELLFEGADGPWREQVDLSQTRSYFEGGGVWAKRIIGLAPAWRVSCPASRLQLRAHDLNIDPQQHRLELQIGFDAS